MLKRWKYLTAVAGAIAAAATMGAAHAAATYGDIASPPGVYFGSGNVNGNWTVDTSNGIEVALRAKNRATLATIDGSSGIYFSAGGLCNPICGGSPKAMWNYELSVNTGGTGGAGFLSGYLVRIGVDTDPSAATNYTIMNVLSNWPDTSYYGDTTVNPNLISNQNSPDPADYAAQQSANPMFGDSGFGYLPGSGLYGIELSVFRLGETDFSAANALARTQITVEVPEPGSLLLLGAGLVAAAAMRRRKVAVA